MLPKKKDFPKIIHSWFLLREILVICSSYLYMLLETVRFVSVLSVDIAVSVKEVRNPASDSESSDVEARSGGEATPPSTPAPIPTERKAIGRSTSVSSSGHFVATPEWVSV